MEAIINSFFLVSIAEIGDKTQLLSFILASRFKKPLPIIAGIFVATIFNHWLAAIFGEFAGDFINPEYQRWILAGIFFVFGLWILIPDKDDGLNTKSSFGAFVTTFISFFIAEMGDKTQLATVALGAQYKASIDVTIGTTLGMLAANVPAVLLGEKILKKLPLKYIRYTACALFMAFAIYIAFFS
ncbi:hypothetical protein M899_0647 [Bacteriovorax sp. BSW11_IV]|uniref:TMEM165/GDT1 family protein n=1 Tax=Bacteriovorax sp. BSW11_IV TaxID=1353529 RepID=UPI00038A498A|nr:TMEM165/GDT1 family protein [Bacteriovorax sp. BSW11_IV]EQC48998.1 hypothetical protein M899_0647 [Bacteriovorax sp. BSW11_IV]